MYFATTKAPRAYTEVSYKTGDYLVFGRETKGLDEKLLAANYEKCVRIPMREEARSLNLANSVAIIAYEALRQTGFESLSSVGSLRGESPHEGWIDYI